VLANLLSNAVKFTEAGEVTVSVALEECGGDAAGRSRVTIDVQDTGGWRLPPR
jgi:signal transduction histidine kinase